MSKNRLFLDNSYESLNALKLCTLYFDDITIVHPPVEAIDINIDEITDTCTIKSTRMSKIDETILNSVTILKQEKIVNDVNIEADFILSQNEKMFFTEFDKFSCDAILRKLPAIFNGIDLQDNKLSIPGYAKIIDSVVINIFNTTFDDCYIKHFKKQLNINKKITRDNAVLQVHWLLEYYSRIMRGLFSSMYHGYNCISNSEFINQTISNAFISGMFKDNSEVHKNVSLDYLEILLPDLSQLSLYDILEVRYKAKDELDELRYYLNAIEKQSVDKNNLIASIDSFKRKIKNAKINTLQKLLAPKSYAPLLAMKFVDIPVFLAAALSLFGVSLDMILEYKKQMNTLKDEKLYFTLKLNKYF